MTDIDYIVSFAVFLSVFIVFFSILGNLLEARSDFTKDKLIENELNIISNNLKQTSLFNNVYYAKIRLAEIGSFQHNENLSLKIDFNIFPENLKVYDNKFSIVPFVYENNILNISNNFLENEEKYYFLIWTNNAKINNFECLDCKDKFITSSIIFSDYCFLRVANFESFNYTKIKNELNIDHNFNLLVDNKKYGPETYKIQHYGYLNIFYLNENYEIENKIIKIGVW